MNTEATESTGIPAWLVMWTLAFGVYGGGKWVTWRAAAPRAGPSVARSAAYLLFWPGMDAAAFLDRGRGVDRPRLVETLLALAKTLFGGAVIWIGVRLLPADQPLIRGWIGMAGMIFLLHFGTFHLLSAAYRHWGVCAEPIMRRPAAATSVASFWAVRWNRGFHDLAHQHLYLPLKPFVGAKWAQTAVFVVSGLLHELVISVPARGGYGLPTAYFAAQAMGISVQRSASAVRLGLCRGWRGWLFTAAFTAGPAFWLFHPPFVHRVICPFLTAIHAI